MFVGARTGKLLVPVVGKRQHVERGFECVVAKWFDVDVGPTPRHGLRSGEVVAHPALIARPVRCRRRKRRVTIARTRRLNPINSAAKAATVVESRPALISTWTSAVPGPITSASTPRRRSRYLSTHSSAVLRGSSKGGGTSGRPVAASPDASEVGGRGAGDRSRNRSAFRRITPEHRLRQPEHVGRIARACRRNHGSEVDTYKGVASVAIRPALPQVPRRWVRRLRCRRRAPGRNPQRPAGWTARAGLGVWPPPRLGRWRPRPVRCRR